MVEETIINKIKHLLAMAEHENSNEHEAAIALERAQELLLRHNLTRRDIQTDGPEPVHPGIGRIEKCEIDGYNWKSHLLNIIAKSNLCHIVVQPSKNTISLFGTYDNVRCTLEMYEWMKPQLENLCNRYWQTYDGSETRRRWNAGFYTGAESIIRERLSKPLQDFTAGAGRAVVLYNAEALTAAVHRLYPYLSRGHLSSGGVDGMGAGKRAGHDVNFRETRKLTGILALKARPGDRRASA